MLDFTAVLADPTTLGYASAALLGGTAGYITRAAHRRGRPAQEKPPGQRGDDALTIAAAAVATAVSAQGMWRVFEHTLHMPIGLRIGTFAFVEIAMLASARRARQNVREHGSAGIDGAAVWVFTALTATLSAMDADSARGVLVRLFAPFVAAWLWERGLSIERRRARKGRTIHWRVTPERVLVRLGLAEPTDRTAGDVDAHRRLIRLARTADSARRHQAAGHGRRLSWTLTRLGKRMDAAVEHAGLATNPARQRQLLALLGAHYNAAGLVDLQPDAPWAASDQPTGMAPQERRDLTDDDLVAIGIDTALVDAELRGRGITLPVADLSRALAEVPRPRLNGNRPTNHDSNRATGPTAPTATGRVRSVVTALRRNRPTDHNDHPATGQQQPADDRPSNRDGSRTGDRAATTGPAQPTNRTGNRPRPATARTTNRPAPNDQTAGDRRPTTPQENDQAVRVALDHLTATGRKIPQRQLADQFNRSTGWARDRIADADRAAADQASDRPGGDPATAEATA